MKLNLAILLLTGIIFIALVFQSMNFGVKEGFDAWEEKHFKVLGDANSKIDNDIKNKINPMSDEARKLLDTKQKQTQALNEIFGKAQPIQRLTKFPDPPTITKEDFDQSGIILINKNKIITYLNNISRYISTNEIHIGDINKNNIDEYMAIMMSNNSYVKDRIYPTS